MRIEQLYDQMYNDETTKSSDRFINIYESHKGITDGLTIEGNAEAHQQLMRLTADYAHHLTMKENYSKALPELDKAIQLFKSYPEFKDRNLFKMEFYETLVFDRAVANYHLKRFSEATKSLKELVAEFPDNDKYKNWLSGAQTTLHEEKCVNEKRV